MYHSKNFGVQVLAFNDDDYLEAVLRIFQPFVDKIVVSVGEKSWRGNVSNDGQCEKIVLRLMREFPNIHLIKGNWKTEEEQRNDNLGHLKECDYVFLVDADELWASEYIHRVMDYVLSHSVYTVFNAFWNTRFRYANWRVDPREPFKPTVLIDNKKGISFFKNRLMKIGINASSVLIPEKLCIIEHFSYVRSDDMRIKEKIRTFSHASEVINGINYWFENVYLQADLKSKYFHPTHMEAYDHLIRDPLHPEIVKFLTQYSPHIINKVS